MSLWPLGGNISRFSKKTAILILTALQSCYFVFSFLCSVDFSFFYRLLLTTFFFLHCVPLRLVLIHGSCTASTRTQCETDPTCVFSLNIATSNFTCRAFSCFDNGPETCNATSCSKVGSTATEDFVCFDKGRSLFLFLSFSLPLFLSPCHIKCD